MKLMLVVLLSAFSNASYADVIKRGESKEFQNGTLTTETLVAGNLTMNGGFVQGKVYVKRSGVFEMRGGFLQAPIYLAPGATLRIKGGFIQSEVYCNACSIEHLGGTFQKDVIHGKFDPSVFPDYEQDNDEDCLDKDAINFRLNKVLDDLQSSRINDAIDRIHRIKDRLQSCR